MTTIRTTIEIQEDKTSIEFFQFPSMPAGKRILSYARGDGELITVNKADALTGLSIIDIKTLLHLTLLWLSLCVQKYGAIQGTDLITSVAFSKPDGKSVISFAGNREVTIAFHFDMKLLAIAEGAAGADVKTSIATIHRIIHEFLEWINRDFALWTSYSFFLPKI